MGHMSLAFRYFFKVLFLPLFLFESSIVGLALDVGKAGLKLVTSPRQI